MTLITNEISFMKRISTLLAVASACALISATASARPINNNTPINVEAKSNGKCIAKFVKWTGNGCGNQVSFECDGADKAAAHTMFDIVQMSYALGLNVDMVVDDVAKVDGFCVATDITTRPGN